MDASLIVCNLLCPPSVRRSSSSRLRFRITSIKTFSQKNIKNLFGGCLLGDRFVCLDEPENLSFLLLSFYAPFYATLHFFIHRDSYSR